jgi:hypothetical protein
MSRLPFCASSLLDVPRPFIDVVSTSLEALGVGSLIFERPRRSSTTVVVLDRMHRGIHLTGLLHLVQLPFMTSLLIVPNCIMLTVSY